MGKKDGGSQTVTQTVDPQTQAYVNYMRQLAMGYATPGYGGAPTATPTAGGGGLMANVLQRTQAGPGMGSPIVQPLPPDVQAAMDQYRQIGQGGMTGFGALTGDPTAAARFMNPYTSTMDPFFAQQREAAVTGANQQATLAGAFGGARSGITGDIAGNLADQNAAAYRMQAFNDAMARAAQAAQMGFGAIGQTAFLPQEYASGQLNLLQQALGPYGQTQQQPLYRNRGAGIIGGAVLGAPLGPLGIIGGGLLGGGIFG